MLVCKRNHYQGNPNKPRFELSSDVYFAGFFGGFFIANPEIMPEHSALVKSGIIILNHRFDYFYIKICAGTDFEIDEFCFSFTLLNVVLSPLRGGGCWDRAQDCCGFH
jgi:hypothetical protein